MKKNEIFKLIKIFKIKFFRFQNKEIIKYLLDFSDKLIKINMLSFY